jgi:hypothetical protein
MPPPAAGREVVVVPGTHSFSAEGVTAVAEAARDWLAALSL